MNIFFKASAFLFMSVLAFLLPLQSFALSDTPDEEVVRSIQERPRILIINGRHSIIDQQITIFSKFKNDFYERNMLVIQSRHPDLIKSDEAENIQLEILDDFTQESFREDDLSLYAEYLSNLNQSNKLVIKLVGKDGGVKKTWNRLIDETDLFYLIDAMPMRQREMR